MPEEHDEIMRELGFEPDEDSLADNPLQAKDKGPQVPEATIAGIPLSRAMTILTIEYPKLLHLLEGDKDAIAPGAWVCDKCGFCLQKNILYAQDGSMSADTSPLNNKCPNDGWLMRPMTWRKANEEMWKMCQTYLGVITEIKSVLTSDRSVVRALADIIHIINNHQL